MQPDGSVTCEPTILYHNLSFLFQVKLILKNGSKMGEKRTIDSSFPLPMDLFFFNDCNICYRQQRCSAETFTLSQFFQICGEVKISGLTDFSDPVQGAKEGRKFIPAGLDVGEFLARYIKFFCVSFIQHLRLNITGMRGVNALPMPVSPSLILASRIFPRLVFP